jgi:hypothetical protein
VRPHPFIPKDGRTYLLNEQIVYKRDKHSNLMKRENCKRWRTAAPPTGFLCLSDHETCKEKLINVNLCGHHKLRKLTARLKMKACAPVLCDRGERTNRVATSLDIASGLTGAQVLA